MSSAAMLLHLYRGIRSFLIARLLDSQPLKTLLSRDMRRSEGTGRSKGVPDNKVGWSTERFGMASRSLLILQFYPERVETKDASHRCCLYLGSHAARRQAGRSRRWMQ